MRTSSPMRYPGGKSSLFKLTSEIIWLNELQHGTYAEPFAGGAGLALSLLYSGHVAEIHLNDIDPAIWAFWYSVINCTDELVDKISGTDVSIEEWHRQRCVLRCSDHLRPVELGFAAFFLNRTNRSGVIKGGGAIGGLRQEGPYKIDCRYNKTDLVKRIMRVAKYKDRIHLTRMDAIAFIESCDALPKRSLMFIDPPYYNKGPGLYMSHYVDSDHRMLADAISRIKTKYIVTYDDVNTIRELYQKYNMFELNVNYSLNAKRRSSELLISSRKLKIPATLGRIRLPIAA